MAPFLFYKHRTNLNPLRILFRIRRKMTILYIVINYETHTSNNICMYPNLFKQ